MRTVRPPGKAVLVAGALAMTLVVGATSGAVAGALITSKDIKDNTIRGKDIRSNAVKNGDIAAGAVNWDKSLDQATKDQIEALIDEGAAGHAGPAGPAGPPGPPGSGGSGGSLVASDYFEGEGVMDADGLVPLVDLDGQGAPVTISEAGNYLISVRSGADISDAFDGELDEDALLGLLGGIGILSLGPAISMDDEAASIDLEALSRSCLSIIVCNTTFGVTVPEGSPLELDLRLLTLVPLCAPGPGCETPVEATVRVYKMGGATAALPTLPTMTIPFCLDSCGDGSGSRREVRHDVRGLVRQLAE